VFLKNRWPIYLFSIAAIGMLVIVAVPSWRLAVQEFFTTPGHEILATAEGDLLGDGSNCKVIKYVGSEGVYVEIRKLAPDGNSSLVDRVLLPDKHDGLFNFRGHVTRLALFDVDKDGKLELLAPTFDNQLVPHLNVLKYNLSTGHFDLITPPAPEALDEN
jgi:hypothetical protein